MANRLSDKFTIEEIKDLNSRINKVFYNATVWQTRQATTEMEQQLIDCIDHLCRVSGMLSDMIEQDLKGDIVTSDPLRYLQGKLSVAEGSLEYYLKRKNVDVSEY
jgi:hypothetical protein